MNELQEKAENYAAEKMNELMVKAIAMAYADGYRDGYKECAEDYDIDLYEDVEFVDLGLPSGLLWSSKYRKNEEGKPLYLTYEDAAILDIPTEEQFSELLKCCKWSLIRGQVLRGGYAINEPVGYYCEGSNGCRIAFDRKGYKFGPMSGCDGVHFRIRDNEDGDDKNTVEFGELKNGTPQVSIEKKSSDYLVPIMLVRKKK
jgi:hypothetical protein